MNLDFFVENIYMRAVIVSKSNGKQFFRLRELKDFLGVKILRHYTSISGEENYVMLKFKTEIEPYLTSVRKVVEKGSDSKYIYRVYLADVKISRENYGILIVAPMKEIIKELVLRVEDVAFTKCDLNLILNDQYKGSKDSKVNVTRLNARNFKDTKVRSIALYGEDIVSVKSQVLKDILGSKLLRDIKGPFTPEKHEPIIEPNSSRLNWDDGATNYGLNIDNFGNFSFYLRTIKDLDGIINILEYVNQIGAFNNSVYVNPIERSDKALNRVAK